MAVRIRKNGRIFCAALRPAEDGDTYIDDDLHYELSVIKKVLVAEPWVKHKISAEWWWRGNVPKNIKIEEMALPTSMNIPRYVAFTRHQGERYFQEMSDKIAHAMGNLTLAEILERKKDES